MRKLIICIVAIVLIANPSYSKDKPAPTQPKADHVPQNNQLDPVKAAAYIPKVAGTTSWQLLLSAELVDLNAVATKKKIALANDAKTVEKVMRGKLGGPLPPKLEVLFSKEARQLDGKEIRLAGFMLPLDMKDKQSHFLLSAYPLSCPYCIPGGPNATIDVHCKQSIEFSYDPVVVRGKLKLLRNDASGFFYRMTDAVPVR